MTDDDTSLHDAAAAIMLLAKTGPRNIVMQVKLSCLFHLGYDQGENVSPERLLMAVVENAQETLSQLPFADWIDSIEIVDITTE